MRTTKEPRFDGAPFSCVLVERDWGVWKVNRGGLLRFARNDGFLSVATALSRTATLQVTEHELMRIC